MKTSNKIIAAYFAGVIVFMAVTTWRSVSDYRRLKPAAGAFLEQLAATQIHAVVVTEKGTGRVLSEQMDMGQQQYHVIDNKPERKVNLADCLLQASISGDTLYIRDVTREQAGQIRFNLPELAGHAERRSAE